jgi:alpha-ketoglutarate-dependent sulfate ester dioxygenase
VPVDIHGERSRIVSGDASHFSSVDNPALIEAR